MNSVGEVRPVVEAYFLLSQTIYVWDRNIVNLPDI